MTDRDQVTQRVRATTARLSRFREQYMLVGGASMVALVPDGDIRHTEDVDLVFKAANYIEAGRVERSLPLEPAYANYMGAKKFQDAELGQVLVDIAFTPFDGYAPSPWYAPGMMEREWSDELQCYVISPRYFLACKWHAYADRGKADPLLSQDLEDIVHLLRFARHDPLALLDGDERVAVYVRSQFRRFFEDDGAEELFIGFAGESVRSHRLLAALRDRVC
jgi:hypothetical protein